MKQMHASVCVDLPADEFKEAEAKLAVKPMWDAFLIALENAKITHTAKLETLETRAKPVTGAKRGRKPRPQTVSTPSLVADEEPDEAA